MQKDATPKRFSLADIVTNHEDWKEYSSFHDSFLEELSYKDKKSFNADIWLLNYI